MNKSLKLFFIYPGTGDTWSNFRFEFEDIDFLKTEENYYRKFDKNTNTYY